MKKLVISGIAIVLSFMLYAQNDAMITKVDYGETLQLEDVSIEFVKIISDSRCPKNVTCIRAGEAKVLVATYKKGKFIGNKTLVFEASGVINVETNLIFNSNKYTISGIALMPYPETPDKIPDKSYCMEIRIN